jgi:hypothetical protein
MSDYYTIVGRYKDHVVVTRVDENIDIEKAQAKGSYYKGTRVCVEDEGGEPGHPIKISQVFLDLPYQSKLKEAISGLKKGDKVTLYKERAYKTSEGEGLTAEEIKEKKLARTSVKMIYKGFITPPEIEGMSNSNTSGGGSGFKRSTKGNVGIQVGHALNAATDLLTAAKAKSKKTLVEAAKALADLTEKLKKEHKENNPKLSDYDIGASVGMAVRYACKVSTKFDQVEDAARSILEGISEEVEAHIKGSEKKTPKKASKEEKKEEKVEEPEKGEEAEEEEDDGLDF